MKTKKAAKAKRFSRNVNAALVSAAVVSAVVVLFGSGAIPARMLDGVMHVVRPQPKPPTLNKVAYDARLRALACAEPYMPFHAVAKATTTSVASSSVFVSALPTCPTVATTTPLWPAKAVYPDAGAIFPFHRVVAYYGNFYSKQMGVLGEYPPAEVIQKLENVAASWQKADPTTPVIPAIDYIAVTAQASAGKDGMYRLRMPDSQIDKALSMAKEVHGLLILDVQVGFSTLQSELPALEKYLKMPDVELAIDPEFAMKTIGLPPGVAIGTFDAKDINYAAEYLANLVRTYHLPPKFLVVHRFTQDMVTHYKDIKPLPEVEIVMDMDGWGSPARKHHTYRAVIYGEPVQFTGFKLFYKNDIRPPSTHMMTPMEVLGLTPRPVFIQYQ